MTVGSAMSKAALRVAGQRPTSFFGSNGQLAVELCDLVNEVAHDIIWYQDWQALIRAHTITGNGSNDSFPFPSDYLRMTNGAELQDLQSWFWGYGYYPDVDQFLRDQASGGLPSPGGWIIIQNRFNFAPAPTGQATFPYISKNYALSQGNNAPTSEFTRDGDSFVLPERLLTLGLVWRWREQKKLDFTGDQEAFVKALDEYAVADRGSRSIKRGGGYGQFRNTAGWVRSRFM